MTSYIYTVRIYLAQILEFWAGIIVRFAFTVHQYGGRYSVTVGWGCDTVHLTRFLSQSHQSDWDLGKNKNSEWRTSHCVT